MMIATLLDGVQKEAERDPIQADAGPKNAVYELEKMPIFTGKTAAKPVPIKKMDVALKLTLTLLRLQSASILPKPPNLPNLRDWLVVLRRFSVANSDPNH